jgi:hypothetical protein
VLTLTPVAVAGTIYGLWLSLREKKNLGFAFVLVFFALFQFAAIATKGTLALARYTLMLGTFCAVLSGYGLVELRRTLVRSGRNDVLAAILVVVLVANLGLIIGLSKYHGPFEDKFRSVSPLMQFPLHVEEVGKFLLPQMRPTDRVLVDSYNDESNLLGIVIGLPLIAKDRAMFVSDQNETDPFPYLYSQRPRFAILSEQGKLGSHLAMPRDCSSSWVIRDMEFRCIFANDVYRVYEIQYGSKTAADPAFSWPFCLLRRGAQDLRSVRKTDGCS